MTTAPTHVEDSDEHDPRPVVRLPRTGLSGAAIALIGLALALLLFAILNAQRLRKAAAPERLQGSAFAPAPPLVIPPEPAPTPLVTVVTTPAPSARIPEPPPMRTRPPEPTYTPPTLVPVPASPLPLPSQPLERPLSRPAGPALVYDGGEQASSAVATQAGQGGGGTRAGAGADDTPARATRISNQTTTMPVGTIIPAVLETPIDTARPGLLRAVVSEDTRGFDGRRVLVQRGSRLIGEYQADVRANQNRVLVNWTRLIRPDGVAIRLGSPASDPLGGAGVPGRLHTYFFQRFASAVLQSALTVGVNLASRPGNNSVIVGLPGTTVNNVVGQGLLSGNQLQPKITVKQGAAVNVFVARDLDFSGVPSRP